MPTAPPQETSPPVSARRRRLLHPAARTARGSRSLQPTAKVPRVNPVHANAKAAALTVSQVGATAPTTNADEQTGGAAYSLRAGPGATAAFYMP